MNDAQVERFFSTLKAANPAPQTEPDPRNGYYETLSAEFARAASELEDAARAAETLQPSAAPAPPPPAQLPY